MGGAEAAAGSTTKSGKKAPLLASSSATVVSSSVTTTTSPQIRKKCKHHEKFCQMTSENQCCACRDKTLRQGKSTTGKAWYANYCPGCYNHHHSRAEEKLKARQAAFASWEKNPDSNPTLTTLAFNFYLRSAKLPFEITHVILSFALRDPPVRFFRTFDRPTDLTTKAIFKTRLTDQEASLFNKPNSKTRELANQRAARCRHTCCSMKTRRSRGCCACTDARPEKHIDCLYIDGQGNIVKEVDFFQYYCFTCRDYWKKHPGEDPFAEEGSGNSSANAAATMEKMVAAAATSASNNATTRSAPVKRKAPPPSTGVSITFISNRSR